MAHRLHASQDSDDVFVDDDVMLQCQKVGHSKPKGFVRVPIWISRVSLEVLSLWSAHPCEQSEHWMGSIEPVALLHYALHSIEYDFYL